MPPAKHRPTPTRLVLGDQSCTELWVQMHHCWGKLGWNLPREERALKAVFSSSVTLRLDRAAVAEEMAFFNIYRKHIERMKERRVQINNYHQFVNSEVLHCVEIQHWLRDKFAIKNTELWRRCSAFWEEGWGFFHVCTMLFKWCLLETAYTVVCTLLIKCVHTAHPHTHTDSLFGGSMSTLMCLIKNV